MQRIHSISDSEESNARSGHGGGTGWRADQGEADACARQSSRDWRPKSGDRKWLVCGTSIRTEEIYKIYAESFNGADHLKQIQSQAQEIVKGAFDGA